MLIPQPAPNYRRLLALVYDSFLVCAILFPATLIALKVNHGESFGPNHIGFFLYLVLCAGLYIIFCWKRGGQTLGMRAWHIKMISQDNKPLSTSQAIVRYFWGVVGFWLFAVGLLWCLFDRDKQTIADKIAHTRMVLAKKSS